MLSEKISIYIPAFNAEKTIEQSINSILNLSVKVDEIIVINDNSTDKTKEILNQFSNIRIINNSKNMGLGFSRNLAIEESKNETIGSIDADVVLDKLWLEKLLEYLNTDNIVMCGGKMLEKLIENKHNAWRAKYYSQNWGTENIVNPPFLYGCNTLQLKSLWKQVGGYDANLLTNGEDIDYTKRINSNKNNQLFYCSEAICYHLQDDNLETLSKRVWRYHSIGYKIKKPSLLKFFKLSIKQLKFFLKRLFSNLLALNFFYIIISFVVLINFWKLEFKNYLKNKT